MEDNRFGKDFEILCALATAGESIGMNRNDWSTLAHDKLLLFDLLKVIRRDAVVRVPVATKVDFSHRPGPKENTWTSHGGYLHTRHHGGSNDWEALMGNLCRAGRSNEIPHPALGHPGYCKLNDPDLLNSNHLDFFLSRPSLTPVEWLEDMTKNHARVFFIGTTFELRVRGGNDTEVVRYMQFNNGQFTADWCSLDVLKLGDKNHYASGRPEKVAYIFRPKKKIAS